MLDIFRKYVMEVILYDPIGRGHVLGRSLEGVNVLIKEDPQQTRFAVSINI